MQSKSVKEQVRAVFEEYVHSHGLRNTPERFAILDAVYSTQGHFDSDSIYHTLRLQNFRVSVATVYNTLEVLCAAGLIFKYQFGTNMTRYERAYNREAHYHEVCTSCGSVSDFESEALDEALQNIRHTGFTPTNYQVHTYGLCRRCAQEAQGDTPSTSTE